MPTLSIRTDDDLPPAAQMALDDGLAARPRPPLLRFYRWNPPAVSCGRGQDPGRIADVTELNRRGWHLVGRPTGGGALLHRGDLTFSLLLPPASGGPREAYATASAIVTAAIARLTGSVPQARGRRTGRPGPVCFLGGHDAEVFAGARKCAGIALRWTRAGSLAQVSLLLEDNAGEAAACILPPPGMTRIEFEERLRAASSPLAGLLPTLPPIREIREAIAAEAERVLLAADERA